MVVDGRDGRDSNESTTTSTTVMARDVQRLVGLNRQTDRHRDTKMDAGVKHTSVSRPDLFGGCGHGAWQLSLLCSGLPSQ